MRSVARGQWTQWIDWTTWTRWTVVVMMSVVMVGGPRTVTAQPEGGGGGGGTTSGGASSATPGAATNATSADAPGAPDLETWANRYDDARAPILAAREADWRNGAIVYQVIVDRFVPAIDLRHKRHLYPEPKRLRRWEDEPRKGTYVADAGVWSHEIDFWGGDLQSLALRLEYVRALGVDVLYLNPIHQAYTNHKYDAQDYAEVSPEYGTREDVRALADALHERGMKLVLDGVFNHMGKTSPKFQDARANADSPWRDWFYIGDEYHWGYRAWANVENLPELRLENPAVRAALWGDDDSVVQGYLRDGADGWRLDVAFDIGFGLLGELTESAHRARPGSLVIGEIWNYPEEWSPALDAVMNMFARQLILDLVGGKTSGAQAGRLLARSIEDAGLEPILKSWIILDNHDTNRLHTEMPDAWRRRMAQVLQFTVPGSPCLYYGTELGMTGGEDPEMRAPMRWDLATEENEEFAWMRTLIGVRRDSRALKVGDFRLLDSETLLAFARRTDRVEEFRVVIANPTGETVTELLSIRDSKPMNWSMLRDALGSGGEAQVLSGLIRAAVPPRTVWVLAPVIEPTHEYTPYKRVR